MQASRGHGYSFIMSDKFNTKASASWREKIRHAFAVDAPGPAEPTDTQRVVVEKLLSKIVERGMAQPAGIFLESWRPLGVLTGQGMQALSPFVGILLDQNAWKEVADYLDKRGAIAWMLQRMDEMETLREGKIHASKNNPPPAPPSQPSV
jgi:hypothetical protein